MKIPVPVRLAALLLCIHAPFALCAESTGQQMAEAAGQPLIGTAAPRLVLKTIDGQTIDLGKLYGKQAVYLKFWATWCVPCRQQMPHFEHTYEAAGSDLAVVAINSGFNDSVDEVRDYRQKLGLTMPIVVDDGLAAAAFHLRVTPQHIVIGRDGRIEYVGHLADARLDAALRDARMRPVSDTKSSESAPVVGERRYKVGDNVPTEAPVTLENTPFALHDPGGKRRTVLVFLSPWCESYLASSRPAMAANCRHLREELVAMKADRGVRFLGIASGLWASSDDLRDYRKQYGIAIPLSLDSSGALFRAFDMNQVPAAVLVDEHGRIVRSVEAQQLEHSGSLQRALDLR
jgi:peroxiredoxin